jgi:hypothetical protein
VIKVTVSIKTLKCTKCPRILSGSAVKLHDSREVPNGNKNETINDSRCKL